MRRAPSVGVPAVLWVPAAFALALIVLPVLGLLTRVDPARLPALLTSSAAVDALDLSVRTSLVATALSLVFGGPLAVVLARARLRGVRVLRAVGALAWRGNSAAAFRGVLAGQVRELVQLAESEDAVADLLDRLAAAVEQAA